MKRRGQERAFFIERNLPEHRVRSPHKRDNIASYPIGRDSAVGVTGQDDSGQFAALAEPRVRQIHGGATSASSVPAIVRQRGLNDTKFERQSSENPPRQVRAIVAAIISKNQDSKCGRMQGAARTVDLTTKCVNASRQSTGFVLRGYGDNTRRRQHLVLMIIAAKNI
jgi:hypothetical protein